jgi:hypothetical protein
VLVAVVVEIKAQEIHQQLRVVVLDTMCSTVKAQQHQVQQTRVAVAVVQLLMEQVEQVEQVVQELLLFVTLIHTRTLFPLMLV